MGDFFPTVSMGEFKREHECHICSKKIKTGVSSGILEPWYYCYDCFRNILHKNMEGEGLDE